MTGQIISSEVSRRALLTGGLAGGFLLAFHVPVRAVNEPVEPPDDTAGKFAPNAFIRIEHSGKTTLVMPQVEMGQGTYTSIPMILAEELDADFSKVTLEHAPPNDRLYANPMLGYQVTGNSSSIRSFWQPLRSAGAAARTMLIQAAAAQWSVSSLRAAPLPMARSSTRKRDEDFRMAPWWIQRIRKSRQRTFV
jgi:isoquinoline 1-oxidoreductase beta subunit